ncbi:MAG: multicopper oxidase domain-containing protein [Chloroflexota bacterium]
MRLLILFMTALLLFVGCSNKDVASGKNSLAIPPIIDTNSGNIANLVLKKGKHQFYPGVKSDTMGFNGSYLGPTIRLHKGSNAKIRFTNKIGEDTSIHGHGLHVNGDIDGGPQQVIKPDTTWEIEIPVQQEAGTNWYHPHLMGKTAKHVHAGLAGLYFIEDENSESLNLPNIYGVNDIPLVIQDRSFTNGKMDVYYITREEMMDGLMEDTLVTNGTVNPYHIAPKGWVRLRLLNGSNARFYRFYLNNKESFYKIATEGGFLDKPVLLDSLTMAPGERNEIMIDLSHIETIHLMADFLPADPEDSSFFMDWFNKKSSVVEIRTNSSLVAQGILPKKLNSIDFFTQSDKARAVVRELHLDMEDGDDVGEENAMNINDMHSMFSINGKSMDIKRIDEKVNKGDLELWRITADMMPHPFHMHGVSFLILKYNGQQPVEADRGWKDTVVVTEKPTEVLMRFNHVSNKKTPYMYHCHILDHEDGGMMGQFTVQ